MPPGASTVEPIDAAPDGAATPPRSKSWTSLFALWREEPASGSPAGSSLRIDLVRLAQVLLGLVSAGLAIVVLAQPEVSLDGLVLLLAAAIGLISAQIVFAGGGLLLLSGSGARDAGSRLRAILPWSIVTVGVIALVLAAFAVIDFTLALTAAVAVLAVALVSQGLGRILQSNGVALPTWLRGSTLGTGVFSIVLVGASVAFFGLALPAFAILVGVILLVTGVETVVAGLGPTDPRQFVLLKLILFAAFYGLIMINWIDLFGKTVPGYGIWLILTYMAPFGVLLVFEGWDAWPLAVSLGLLVSLFNDVGYFFIGNLIFGFHEALGPWIAGQLGFRGSFVVTTFEGGRFSIEIESWMMGLSIYLRAIVVGVILYYWWRHPGGIVARSVPRMSPEPAPPSAPRAGDASTPPHLDRSDP